MEDHVPFNRLLGIRGESVSPGRGVLLLPAKAELVGDAGLGGPLRAEAELVRKGNRVCHVRVRVTQDGRLIAEGRAVYNIHRRSTPESP